MGLHIELESNRLLHVTIFGDFNFELSRDVLLRVKAHCRNGVTDVLIMLNGVTRISSAAIGTLALLAEIVGSRVSIRSERCAEQVYVLFSPDFLGRYFPNNNCHEKKQNLIPLSVLKDRQAYGAQAKTT